MIGISDQAFNASTAWSRTRTSLALGEVTLGVATQGRTSLRCPKEKAGYRRECLPTLLQRVAPGRQLRPGYRFLQAGPSCCPRGRFANLHFLLETI